MTKELFVVNFKADQETVRQLDWIKATLQKTAKDGKAVTRSDAMRECITRHFRRLGGHKDATP